MKIEVVKNAKRNILFGGINRLIVMICPFIERTLIQYYLGTQYLGLSSLFTSILSVLSLTELGFSSAMVYNMYKPIAEGNTNKINALLNFYKKVYRIIGIAVLSIGILLIPLLPKLIKGSYPQDINLAIVYLVFVANSSISYFLFGYLTSILVAHQRDDVQSTVNSAVKILITILEAIVLISLRSYYCFIILMPLGTVINNMWVAYRTRKLFPQYKAEGNITNKDKQEIKRVVAGTFIQRACGVSRNSLDSICISAFIGLTLTAVYNNYFLILNGITTMVSVVSTAFTGGVGNHVAVRSVEDNFDELNKLNFVYLWISGFCTACLLCLYQPFMKLWMGEELMLPYTSVVLLCIYFYLLKLGDVLTLYSSANGLWWEQRYRSISETVLNLILNILLGKLFGVNGIIIATIVSLVLCNYLWATKIIFQKYFGVDRLLKYYIFQGVQSILVLIGCLLSVLLCGKLIVRYVFIEIVIRFLVCFVVMNLIMLVAYRKSENIKYLFGAIRK